jgi:hypothetical protein
MTPRAACLLLGSILLMIRLPSLVQPMGADQALYTYVGERIRAGELPYRDAWDQKPPGVHYTYAAMRAVWPRESVVPAADLVAALLTSVLLAIGVRGLAPAGTGATAALLFLLLSNPAFTRLAGVRIRAQAETFIALATMAALVLLVRSRARASMVFIAGVFLGAAFVLKYNAAVFAIAALGVLWALRALTPRNAAALVTGCAVLPVATLGWFVAQGAFRDLYNATITYNLQYSGETYDGPVHFVRYLLTFPVAHARLDALWTLGGAGCALLLVASVKSRERLIPVIWVAAGCVSMAINGSRGLPQYFIQVLPALALAAGWAGALTVGAARRTGRAANILILLLAAGVAVAAWRVNQFPKLAEQTWFDTQYAFGRLPRDVYLARYVDGRKYTALGAVQLGELMAERSAAHDRVYLFGFTPAAYLHADRASASRFFWSRPVIAGFKEGTRGYGAEGVLADLERTRPAVIALQEKDWAPDVADSASYFMSTPSLATWLTTHYTRTAGPEGFDVWLRR